MRFPSPWRPSSTTSTPSLLAFVRWNNRRGTVFSVRKRISPGHWRTSFPGELHADTFHILLTEEIPIKSLERHKIWTMTQNKANSIRLRVKLRVFSTKHNQNFRFWVILSGLFPTVKLQEGLFTSSPVTVAPKTSVMGLCDGRFRWRRRLLIISSPSDEEWSFQQQLYSLNSQACNLGTIVLRNRNTLNAKTTVFAVVFYIESGD